MTAFFLHRTEDVSGTSGLGVVAQGVQFDDGQCVVHWNDRFGSIGVYKSMQDVVDIHGHGGKTEIMWGYPEVALLCGGTANALFEAPDGK